MVVENFLKEWDRNINLWIENPKEFTKNHLLYKNYKGNEKEEQLQVDYLPEPYLGDPRSCNAVVLNLNPGGVLLDQSLQRYDGIFVNEIKNNSYSTWASNFVYANSNSLGNGSDFWSEHKKWINRFNENNTTTFDLFDIELVPFHSEKFGKLVYNNDVIEYILKKIMTVSEYITINYTKSKFIFCFTRKFSDIFERIGSDKIKRVLVLNKDKHPSEIGWPYNKHGKPINRTYEIWVSDSCKYLVIWSVGGQKCPSNDFKDVERYIANYEY